MKIPISRNRRNSISGPFLYIISTLILLVASFNAESQTSKTFQDTTIVTANTYIYNTIHIKGTTRIIPGSGLNVRFHSLSSGCNPLNTAFDSTQNYVLTSIPRKASYNPLNKGYTTCDVMQTVQYIDGLGRPLQTVQVKGGPNATTDVVQPFVYDQFGREVVKYLPYTTASNNGSYKPNAISDQATFYTTPPSGVTTISLPYSQTVYEPSPLNRTVEQGAPGNDWQPLGTPNTTATAGHTVKITYGTNATNEVALWIANANGNGATGTTFYSAGQLSKTATTNENGNQSIEFKDKENHVVCKKAQLNASTFIATYYVYNDLNNLVYVIPPISSGTISSFIESDAVCSNYIYGYHYDSRNRAVQKKIPGKGWEYAVYNSVDLPVLSQDAVQRGTNQWTVTKYDALGRVIMTGLWNAGAVIDQGTLQGSIYNGAQWDNRDNTVTATGYNITSYPAISKVLAINYYDDYSFPGLPAGYSAPSGTGNTTGLLTGSRTTILNTIDNTNTNPLSGMLWSVHYYDGKGRNIVSYAQHYLGGVLNTGNYDLITTNYNDFTSEVNSVIRNHVVAGNTAVLIANSYTYDHMGRKIKTYEQINGGTNVLLSQVDYNEIGQMLTKHLGNDLQQVAYTYNERGWLRTENTNGNLFNLDLRYNNPDAGPTQQYNGNISQMSYLVTKVTTPGIRTFAYTYDALNRLTNAGFTGGTTGDALNENITYDLMGNITQLVRGGNSGGTLNYTSYTGNQLNTVTGYSPRTYVYDLNGNATSDGQGKGINYNMLNLPQSVMQGTTTLATYTYDATGQKLRNTGSDGTWDYINGIVYKNGAITFINTEEGRIAYNSSTYNYEYNLQDHLGNNRVSFDSNSGTARIIQEDEYYSFGLRKPTGGYDLSNNNRYLYNGKEIQTDLTNQYDYGARFYDPVIARWTSVDPLAEISRRFSPYDYVEDNPIRNIDPDGMYSSGFGSKAITSVDLGPGGKVSKINQDGDPGVYLNMDGSRALIGFMDPSKKYSIGETYQYYGKKDYYIKWPYFDFPWWSIIPRIYRSGDPNPNAGQNPDVAAFKQLSIDMAMIFLTDGLGQEMEGAEFIGPDMLPSAIGKQIIGWGEGPEGGVQAEVLLKSLTQESVQAMEENGLEKRWVVKYLEKYTNAANNIRKANAANTNLKPRIAILKKILELWK